MFIVISNAMDRLSTERYISLKEYIHLRTFCQCPLCRCYRCRMLKTSQHHVIVVDPQTHTVQQQLCPTSPVIGMDLDLIETYFVDMKRADSPWPPFLPSLSSIDREYLHRKLLKSHFVLSKGVDEHALFLTHIVQNWKMVEAYPIHVATESLFDSKSNSLFIGQQLLPFESLCYIRYWLAQVTAHNFDIEFVDDTRQWRLCIDFEEWLLIQRWFGPLHMPIRESVIASSCLIQWWLSTSLLDLWCAFWCTVDRCSRSLLRCIFYREPHLFHRPRDNICLEKRILTFLRMFRKWISCANYLSFFEGENYDEVKESFAMWCMDCWRETLQARSSLTLPSRMQRLFRKGTSVLSMEDCLCSEKMETIGVASYVLEILCNVPLDREQDEGAVVVVDGDHIPLYLFCKKEECERGYSKKWSTVQLDLSDCERVQLLMNMRQLEWPYVTMISDEEMLLARDRRIVFPAALSHDHSFWMIFLDEQLWIPLVVDSAFTPFASCPQFFFNLINKTKKKKEPTQSHSNDDEIWHINQYGSNNGNC